MGKATAHSVDEIRKSIFDAFYWDSRIDDFSNIDVRIDEGEVTLIGSAPNHATRKYAAFDAAAVPGVLSVDNRLTIKYNDNVKIPSDAEISSNILNVIVWNSSIDTGRLTVSVNRGYALLQGTVPTYYQKSRAHELAADVIGVTSVDNRITVVPTEEHLDESISRNVIDSLKSRLGTDADSVTVMVTEGVVTLTGAVPDIIAFQAAENVVHHIRGITDLHNHLTIR